MSILGISYSSQSLVERALGSFVGAAVGDALGAYRRHRGDIDAPRHRSPVNPSLDTESGWSADVDIAIMVAQVAAQLSPGESLRDPSALDHIAARWYVWFRQSRDPGLMMGHLLNRAGEFALDEGYSVPRGIHLQRAAAHYYSTQPHADTSGSMLRAHVVALAAVNQPAAETAAAARVVHSLTHVAPDAGDATVLWSLLVRQALHEGRAEPREWLGYLAADRVELWRQRIEAAESLPPAQFQRQEGAAAAFQSAWGAIYRAGAVAPVSAVDAAVAFSRSLGFAQDAGRDAATVGIITGGLAGALYGQRAIDRAWVSSLNGWPGMHAKGLMKLAQRIYEARVAA